MTESVLRYEGEDHIGLITLAGKIAANPPLAVQALKAGLRRTMGPYWRDTGRWASQQIQPLRRTEDSTEGVRAFLEKRAPVYVGRCCIRRLVKPFGAICWAENFRRRRPGCPQVRH